MAHLHEKIDFTAAIFTPFNHAAGNGVRHFFSQVVQMGKNIFPILHNLNLTDI